MKLKKLLVGLIAATLSLSLMGCNEFAREFEKQNKKNDQSKKIKKFIDVMEDYDMEEDADAEDGTYIYSDDEDTIEDFIDEANRVSTYPMPDESDISYIVYAERVNDREFSLNCFLFEFEDEDAAEEYFEELTESVEEYCYSIDEYLDSYSAIAAEVNWGHDIDDDEFATCSLEDDYGTLSSGKIDGKYVYLIMESWQETDSYSSEIDDICSDLSMLEPTDCVQK